MAQGVRYSEIGEQVLAIQNQAKSLVAITNALLRQLAPLIEEEAGTRQERPSRPVFGKSEKETHGTDP